MSNALIQSMTSAHNKYNHVSKLKESSNAKNNTTIRKKYNKNNEISTNYFQFLFKKVVQKKDKCIILLLLYIQNRYRCSYKKRKNTQV